MESALNAVTRLDAQAALQKQAVYLDAEAGVRALCETGQERIYVLAPGSGGFEYQVMRYRLRPLVVLDAPWNPVDDPAAVDRFTACLSPEELMEGLLESDLVLVFGSTEAFVQTYGSLFAQLPQEGEVTDLSRGQRKPPAGACLTGAYKAHTFCLCSIPCARPAPSAHRS